MNTVAAVRSPASVHETQCAPGATTPVRSRREAIACMIDFFVEGVARRPDVVDSKEAGQ